MAAAAGRNGAIWAWCFWAPLLVFLVVMASTRPALAGKPGGLPEGDIAEIKIVGNASITSEQVRGKIKSRAGRPIDQATLDSDLRALHGTKWFSDVGFAFEEAPNGKGIVLVIQVVEMPVLKDVQFIGLIEGWGHVKLKDIEEATQLKKGGRADSVKAQLAIHQIQSLYEEKGFEKAEVRLIEGGKVGDSKVVIEIFEGPKFKIESIDFVGNTFVEDGVLATKIESRRGFFGTLGARRQKEGLENDKRALYKYYQDNGFFDVHVSAVTKPGKALGEEQIVFTISEGAQYKVKDILIEGNKQIPGPKLREGMLLKPGEPFNENVRDIDHKAMMTKYWGIGCIKTKIEKDQPVTDEPGFVRVIYRIEEGNPYILGQLIVRGNARTKDKVVRREALMAGLLPGEMLDLNRVDIFKRRLGSTGYFSGSPNQPGGQGPGSKGIDIKVVNERSGDKPFGEDVLIEPNGVNLTRMQSPDQDPPPPTGDLPVIPPLDVPPAMPPLEVPSPPARGPGLPEPGPAPAGGAPGPQGAIPFGSDGLFDPTPNTVPPVLGPPPSTAPQPPFPPRRNPGALNPSQEPNLPNNNMNDVGPDRQEPFPGRSYADIVTNVDEAPTGRLMFGFGASSFGGLSGTAILHESNFDLFAIPRSFSELGSGRAFRGAGQELRISLSPGTLMQPQYLVSFRDPYLFDQPLGLGVSAYATSRYYPDFSERRAGGRFSLGYQFGPQTYADVGVPDRGRRDQQVQVSRARRPARRGRPHHPGHDPAGHPVRQPQQPGLNPPRGRTWKPPSSRAGGRSPTPSSPSKASSTSPPEAAPTARASGPSPCPRALRHHRARHADLRAVLRRRLPEHARLLLSGRRPARPGREHRRRHGSHRLDRVPVPLDRQRQAPAGRLLRLRHRRGQLLVHHLPRSDRHRPPRRDPADHRPAPARLRPGLPHRQGRRGPRPLLLILRRGLLVSRFAPLLMRAGHGRDRTGVDPFPVDLLEI